MLRVSNLKTVGRAASLVLLLVAMTGPWFSDSHPATEETCTPPLVWKGNGYCACLVPLLNFSGEAPLGESELWLLALPPVLPALTTLLLLLTGERRRLWTCHLAAWGLVAVYSLLIFLFFIIIGNIFTWGGALGSVVAVAVLVWEIRIARRYQELNRSNHGNFLMKKNQIK